MTRRIDAVGVCSAAAAPGLPSPGPRPPHPTPPKNRSEKKSSEIPLAPSQRKVIAKADFRVCRGLWKFLSEARKKFARARQVPRGLPRGRGAAMPKRSRMSKFSGPRGQFLSASCSARNCQLPKAPEQILSSSLGPTRTCAMAPCPVPGGRFPFPREKGSEKGSYQTLAGVARKPDFLQKSG